MALCCAPRRAVVKPAQNGARPRFFALPRKFDYWTALLQRHHDVGRGLLLQQRLRPQLNVDHAELAGQARQEVLQRRAHTDATNRIASPTRALQREDGAEQVLGGVVEVPDLRVGVQPVGRRRLALDGLLGELERARMTLEDYRKFKS